VPTVRRPTRPRKWPGPLDTFGPRMKNKRKASALQSGGGRQESDGYWQLGVAGRVQGASQQGDRPDLGWLRGGGSLGWLVPGGGD
jgi:hypothetical protein